MKGEGGLSNDFMDDTLWNTPQTKLLSCSIEALSVHERLKRLIATDIKYKNCQMGHGRHSLQKARAAKPVRHIKDQ